MVGSDVRSKPLRAFVLLSLSSLACVPPPGPHDNTAGQVGPAAAAGGGEAEQVCKRAGELATKDGESAEVAAQLEQDCVASLGELEGYYAKTLACMQGAGDLRELKSCERGVSSYESMFEALAPTPEQLCDHLMGLIKVELAGQVPDSQLPVVRSKCVVDAARELSEDSKAFAKKARCVISKTNIEGLRECEGTNPQAAQVSAPPARAPAPRPLAPSPAATLTPAAEPAPAAAPEPEPTPTPASP